MSSNANYESWSTRNLHRSILILVSDDRQSNEHGSENNAHGPIRKFSANILILLVILCVAFFVDTNKRMKQVDSKWRVHGNHQKAHHAEKWQGIRYDRTQIIMLYGIFQSVYYSCQIEDGPL